MCGILFCGITIRYKKEDTIPLGYTPCLKQVICPYCVYKGDTVYKRKTFYFSLFFTPICMVKTEEPYLYCVSCNAVLGKSKCNVCTRCNTATPIGFSFCVTCGNDVMSEKLNNMDN